MCVMAWRNNLAAFCTVLGVIVSFSARQVACAFGDDDCGAVKTAQYSCGGQCGCHGVPLPLKGLPLRVSIAAGKFVAQPLVDTSRVVPASIFNPPRS